MRDTISNDKEHKRHSATLSSVIAKLKELKPYSKANMLDFITNEKHLDLRLPQEFLDTDPGIQDLWLFLSWFLQFISPVELFSIECGHRSMVMMKFFLVAGLKTKHLILLINQNNSIKNFETEFLRKVRLRLRFLFI